MKLSYSKKNMLKWTSFSFAILIIGYFYLRYPFYKIFPNIWWARTVWLLGIFLIAGIFKVVAIEAVKWRKGNEAEQDIEDESYELPENFIILKDIVIGERGNIDEVIIGPTGIWVIEVKSHTGKINFDGKELRRDGELLEKNFLKQAWAEKCDVRDILKKELNKNFSIRPVICFSDEDAELHFGFKPIEGVYVIGRSWLNKLILKDPVRLNDSVINEIVKILEKYEE